VELALDQAARGDEQARRRALRRMKVRATGLLVLAAAVSSYLAMNFTGSTPFTSPSGVEKEMRRAIPLQAAALLAFVLAWVGSAFAG